MSGSLPDLCPPRSSLRAAVQSGFLAARRNEVRTSSAVDGGEGAGGGGVGERGRGTWRWRACRWRGETVSATSGCTLPGGKGANQAAAGARLGHPTYLIGQVGSDANGAMLSAALAGTGVRVDHLVTLGAPAPASSSAAMTHRTGGGRGSSCSPESGVGGSTGRRRGSGSSRWTERGCCKGGRAAAAASAATAAANMAGGGGEGSVATGQAIVMLQADGSNAIIIVGGANMAWSKRRVEGRGGGRRESFFSEQAREAIRGAGMVLLQRELPDDVNAEAAELAGAAGVPVVLDMGGMDGPLPDAMVRRVAVMSPNETELSRLTGLPVSSIPDAERAALTLLAKGVPKVLVKLGSSGSLLVSSSPLAPASSSSPLSATLTTGTDGSGRSCVAAAAASGAGAHSGGHNRGRRYLQPLHMPWHCCPAPPMLMRCYSPVSPSKGGRIVGGAGGGKV
ncbi:unnamed protein product [Closterium sp. NIES-65]|nr:unnamed protein product [Closterium sp. NIES-65]